MRLKEAEKGCMGVPPGSVTRPCACGVDIRPGNYDVAIGEVWRLAGDGRPPVAKLVFYGKVEDDDDVEFLVGQYPVSCGVIDSRPEGTMAKRTVDRLRKKRLDFWRAQYNTNPSNVELTVNEKEHLLTLERTMTMDNVLYGLQAETIALPQNYRDILRAPGQQFGQFVAELMTPTRVARVWSGQDGYEWTKGQDHSFHALNYMLVAMGVGKLYLPRGRTMMPIKGRVQGTLSDMMDEQDGGDIYPSSSTGGDYDEDEDSGAIVLEL